MTTETVPASIGPHYACGRDDCLLCAAGLTYRQLDWWCRAGYLNPVTPGGSGRRREWPESELEIARRMAVLTAAGIAVAVAARFARDGWPDGEIAPGLHLEAFGEAEATA